MQGTPIEYHRPGTFMSFLAGRTGVSFTWEVDQYGDSSEWSDEKPPYQQWVCIARDKNGRVIGSLGGVDFGRDGSPYYGDPYRRVVEAEIASEARHAR